MQRILIIEDERRLAHNISQTLLNEGYQTCQVHDGYSALQQGLSESFDAVLLDINLPGVNGHTICRRLRAAYPRLPIIMLTALGQIEDKVEGLNWGADDYIVKPFDLRELTARVAACLRRSARANQPQVEPVLRMADLELNYATRQVSRAGQLIALTAKEYALLVYMLQHSQRVLSKQELTERVWHLNFDPGTNVVEVYINFLRKKLDKGFSPKLIHTRSGQGYILAVK
jgi:DNA-binding response OmpR family regulator